MSLRRHPLLALLSLGVFAGALTGCGKDSAADTAASGFDGDGLTENGLFHLTVAMTPDPPTVGPASLAMSLALAADETPVETATVSVSVFDSANQPLPSAPITGMEGGGDYLASWAYPGAGVWTVRVDIEDDTGSDFVLMSAVVGD